MKNRFWNLNAIMNGLHYDCITGYMAIFILFNGLIFRTFCIHVINEKIILQGVILEHPLLFYVLKATDCEVYTNE